MGGEAEYGEMFVSDVIRVANGGGAAAPSSVGGSNDLERRRRSLPRSLTPNPKPLERSCQPFTDSTNFSTHPITSGSKSLAAQQHLFSRTAVRRINGCSLIPQSENAYY